uniref:Uncharacterized protein LOC123613620 n=1 Tax=Camelus bactrianus TaxID=9837 RepID=A0A9W3FPY5_CAMBA|nr:uncharacterized protein LOC123613620 [Camelus bactrianus]
MIFVQTVLIPQSAHLQSSAVCRSYSSRPCTSHLLFGPHGCALSFLAGEARTLNTAEAGEAVQQDLEEREGLYPPSSVSGPRARGGKVSLVSCWFSMFSSDASAPEDEMVFKQVKRGSPLLLGGREEQTRLPSGFPAVQRLRCFSGLCISHPSASRASLCPFASPRTPHPFTWNHETPDVLAMSFKIMAKRLEAEKSSLSKHSVSSSLIGSGFSTLTFRNF